MSKLRNLFRPLDTAPFDEALAAFDASTKKVNAHARALRMDIGCGDPEEIANGIKAITCGLARQADDLLHRMFVQAHPVNLRTPPDMKRLLGKL